MRTTLRATTRTTLALLAGLLGLAVVGSTTPAQAADSVTRTPWQMYITPTPHGTLSNGFSSTQHGATGFYVDAVVPAVDAALWRAAPDGEIIGFDGRVAGFGGPSASRLRNYTCLRAVDYTYFQSLVTVPANTTISQFSVNFNGIDDGARISVYNSAYPTGVVVPGSYVFLNGSGTSNLASYITEGVNRIVVTQLDDCAIGNNLREARISINSTTIPTAQPPVVSVTGVAQGATYPVGSVPAAGCSVVDPQDGTVSVTPTLSPVTGPLAARGLGSQTATCTYTNSRGLTRSATATYTIIDPTAPVITVPADRFAGATGPGGAVVTFPAPTATDNVDGPVPVTCTHASGDTFPIGSTTVTCTATDSSGNAASRTFVVTVADTTPPVVTVPADITRVATDATGADVTFAATAVDTVDGPLTPTCSPASGSHFPVGTTVVTCSATDAAGFSASRTFRVTVTPLAGLSVTKSVDRPQAAPGQMVTYTVVAANAGPSAAQDVVVSDPLPAGLTLVSATADTGTCTATGNDVSCLVGTIAPGTSRTVTIVATVDPVTATTTDSAHQLAATKVETHLAVPPAGTSPSVATAVASCPSGYRATDGGIRVDSIDQGTGTVSDLHVVESRATADGRGWTGTLSSTATGQVQGKVTVVCVSEVSTTDAGHAHPLLVSAPVTATTAWTAGQQSVDLACASGRVAVAPGWTVTAGAADLVSSTATATGWRMVFDVPASAAVVAEVRCLSTSLGVVAGHTHDLALDTVTSTVSVPAGGTAEASLSCSDDGKGIVAGVRGARGLALLGTDPQPKTRLFRLGNTTGSALDADLSLLCLEMHAGPAVAVSTITNTATVSTSTPDQTTVDDSSSASFTATAGAGPVAPRFAVTASAGSVRGRAVALTLASTTSSTVSLRLVTPKAVPGARLKAGSVLAARSLRVVGGRQAVSLRLGGAAAKAVAQRRLTRAQLVVRAADGTVVRRWVALQPR